MEPDDLRAAWANMGDQIVSMQHELSQLRRWKETVDQYPDLPAVLRPKDVAAAAKVSLSSAYAIMSDGSMKVFYAGRSPRCSREEFIRWMQSGGCRRGCAQDDF